MSDRTTGNESHIKLWVNTPLAEKPPEAFNKINLLSGTDNAHGYLVLWHSISACHCLWKQWCTQSSKFVPPVVVRTTFSYLVLWSVEWYIPSDNVGVLSGGRKSCVHVQKYTHGRQDVRDLSRTLYSPSKKIASIKVNDNVFKLLHIFLMFLFLTWPSTFVCDSCLCRCLSQ